MEHCVRYECVMNGSNSLGETDRQPSFACPECQEKLRWNAGFDPRARWAALAGFYASVGLADVPRVGLPQGARHVPGAPPSPAAARSGERRRTVRARPPAGA